MSSEYQKSLLVELRARQVGQVFVFLIALSLWIIPLGAAQADDLAGVWKGTWTKDGDVLPVTMTFAKMTNAWSGSFDSDTLQVAGIPVVEVTDANGKVRFQIKGDQNTTVFEGIIADQTISGTFREGNSKGTFELARATVPTPEIRMRTITFQDKDVTLAGTLLIPAGPGKHPAILFLQGSGPEGRWANRRAIGRRLPSRRLPTMRRLQSNS